MNQEQISKLIKEKPFFIWNLFKKIYPLRHFLSLNYPVKSHPRYGYGKPSHQKLYEIINKNRDTYQDYLKQFLKFKNNYFAIPKYSLESNSIEPYWSNMWFSSVDAIALYGFLCLYNSKKYFEIGSGNSTLFANKAIRDHHLLTKITSIDPHPRANIDMICNVIIRKSVEEIDIMMFDELEAGDILFIDNSHRVFMNSDVTVVFLDILPRLKPGVLVQFHDIYLPFDYSAELIEKYYSEQYMLAVYILAEGSKFEVILPNQFILNDSALRDIINPVFNDLKKELDDSKNDLPFNGYSFWIQMK